MTRALDVFAEGGINVRGFSAGDTGEYGIVRFIVDKPEEAIDLLTQRGAAVRASQVLCVRLDDFPGELRRVLRIMADLSLNVVYCYSLTGNYIALAVKNIAEAEAALEDEAIALVDQAEISSLDL